MQKVFIYVFFSKNERLTWPLMLAYSEMLADFWSLFGMCLTSWCSSKSNCFAFSKICGEFFIRSASTSSSRLVTPSSRVFLSEPRPETPTIERGVASLTSF